jgi:IS5 family transposase
LVDRLVAEVEVMKQQSFSDAEYDSKRKRTRREVFLLEMDGAAPWSRLAALIEPHYPKAGVGPIRWRRCCGSTACSSGTR